MAPDTFWKLENNNFDHIRDETSDLRFVLRSPQQSTILNCDKICVRRIDTTIIIIVGL